MVPRADLVCGEIGAHGRKRIVATSDSIRLAMRAQPFRPFSVRLVDGTVYEVKHPDWLFLPPVSRPREVLLYNLGPGGAEDYEARWLDLGLVMEVILGSAPAVGTA
jgi:hypothetical protein